MKNWESCSLISTGSCRVTSESSTNLVGTYELVSVTTGRSKVFWGYRLTLEVDGQQFIGEDRHNMIDAVRHCGYAMQAAGYMLCVNAMSDSFQESGLSANSGYGYIDGHEGSEHMMADLAD